MTQRRSRASRSPWISAAAAVLGLALAGCATEAGPAGEDLSEAVEPAIGTPRYLPDCSGSLICAATAASQLASCTAGNPNEAADARCRNRYASSLSWCGTLLTACLGDLTTTCTHDADGPSACEPPFD